MSLLHIKKVRNAAVVYQSAYSLQFVLFEAIKSRLEVVEDDSVPEAESANSMQPSTRGEDTMAVFENKCQLPERILTIREAFTPDNVRYSEDIQNEEAHRKTHSPKKDPKPR